MVLIQKRKDMIQLTSLLLCILFSISSCKKEEKMDDTLSINKVSYSGTQIRTDGYYYNEYVPGYLTVYFFYRDGTLLYGNSFPIVELQNQEEKYKNGEHYTFSKDFKSSWGVFSINNNSIEFERWYPSQPPLRAYIRSGIIISDTTFHIKEFKSANGSVIETRDEVYYFKPFTPKPDSANNFIK